MANTSYIAIKLLCEILDSFPTERRKDALRRTGLAIGRGPDLTGIPVSVDRPIKHLYWDVEIDQLKDRMIQLVDEIGVDEGTIVLGVIQNLDWHFRRHADRDFTEECRNGQINTINGLRADLEKPFDQRAYKESDEGIRAFIKKIETAIGNIELDRQNAEDALHYLQLKSEPLFDWKLWNSIAHLKIEQMRPGIDGNDDSEAGK